MGAPGGAWGRGRSQNRRVKVRRYRLDTIRLKPRKRLRKGKLSLVATHDCRRKLGLRGPAAPAPEFDDDEVLTVGRRREICPIWGDTVVSINGGRDLQHHF